MLVDYPGLADHTGLHSFLAQGGPWCLYLWGSTGSRKTSIALAILKALREDRPDQWGEFVPSYKAVETLRAVDSDEAKASVKRWRSLPCLVLDDLLKGRDTPHVIESLLFLLHYRYDWANGQKTIITANCHLDELGKRIDPATARRIAEGVQIELVMA